MSGFGVKTPLRGAIVTDDFMFNTAAGLKIFLEKEFEEDHSKIYEVIRVYYLEKISEKKLYIHYKQLKKLVYFYPSEVFSPWVPINEDLCLSLAEYQFLSDSI